MTRATRRRSRRSTHALGTTDAALALRARTGKVRAALRIAEFSVARREGEALKSAAASDPEIVALYADSLWAAGLFDEAEEEYREALALNPGSSRAQARFRAIAGQPQPAYRSARGSAESEGRGSDATSRFTRRWATSTRGCPASTRRPTRTRTTGDCWFLRKWRRSAISEAPDQVPQELQGPHAVRTERFGGRARSTRCRSALPGTRSWYVP